MKIVTIGKWKIAVDIEKTKAFYANFESENSQANRNFAEYCKNLTIEEKDFFNSFGIDPINCNIDSFGVDKKKWLPSVGHYFVCGEYLEVPKGYVIANSQEELDRINAEHSQLSEEEALSMFCENQEDSSTINIGVFQFYMMDPEHELPDNQPDNYICIGFSAEKMPWLLDEKPEDIYGPVRFWQISRKIRYKREAKELLHSERLGIEQTLSKLGIKFYRLSNKEVDRYRKIWVEHYAPDSADLKQIKENCYRNKKYSTYLWHMFSWHYLHSKEEQEARDCFNQANKEQCTLVDNWSEHSYYLEDAEKLTDKILDELFADVTITANDFSWTYSKTHEFDCGPYFFSR